jgi:hypothetical protein
VTSENPEDPFSQQNPAPDASGKPDTHAKDPQQPITPVPTESDPAPCPYQREVTCNTKRDWIDKMTLGLEAFGLFVLIVYTIFTGLMYCANMGRISLRTSRTS